MMRGAAPLLLAALWAAPASHAQTQTPPPVCPTGLHHLENTDAAETWQSLHARLQVLFSEGNRPDTDTQVFILLPRDMAPLCPDGALERLTHLRRVAEGVYTGRVLENGISDNRHLFGAQVVFYGTEVLEWKPHIAAPGPSR